MLTPHNHSPASHGHAGARVRPVIDDTAAFPAYADGAQHAARIAVLGGAQVDDAGSKQGAAHRLTLNESNRLAVEHKLWRGKVAGKRRVVGRGLIGWLGGA